VQIQGATRIGTLVAVAAIVLGACSSGGASTAPSSAASAAPSAAPTAASAAPDSAAAGGLTGNLTVWHSYGSGAVTEA
jgi:hypothetical protein